MKDFENQDADALRGIVIDKPGANSHVHDTAEYDVAEPSIQKIEALRNKELSHPANAIQLADMMTELQQNYGNDYVQRVVAGMHDANSSATGHGLDANVRAEMEAGFGENFGDVIVHRDSEAEAAAGELDARAITHGRDIYFGRGEYNPATPEGKELLAHELTHVIQQRGNTASPQTNAVGSAQDAFEQEADRAAAAIVHATPMRIAQRSAAPRVQLQPKSAPPSPPAKEQPKQATPGLMNVTINVAANPSGVLPNGVRYRYVPQSPEPYLDFVIPEDMTLSAASPRNQTRILYVSGGHELGPHERAAIVMVTPVAGQTAVVQITFRQGSARGFAIFELPRFR